MAQLAAILPPRPAPFLRARAAALLLLSLSWLALGPRVSAQEPAPATIRLDVDLVPVGVIVTDTRGNFVENLPRSAFHVFDNAAEQPIAQFAPVREPGQVLLLLESGPAVYFLQDSHLFAADELLRGLSSGDQVAVAGYSDTATLLLPFTPNKAQAQATLDNITFSLGFGSLNLSGSLNAALDWLASVPGKKTILLLSTGVDTSPPAVAAALNERLRTGDVRVLCVSLSGPLRNGKKGSRNQIEQLQIAFDQADARLKSIAESTGGRVFFPKDANSFPAIYRQVAQLVRNEYTLSFVPPIKDGAVHAISVSVDSPDAKDKKPAPAYRVDHRGAYVAPQPVQPR